MCTSPILIKNRKFKHLSCSHRNQFLKVPCGKCDECLRKRAKDIYVRARCEYDYCLRSGGCGFMCCLTYSPDLVPYLEYEGRKYKVFNKKHVIDFVKRLRTNLNRFYNKYYGSCAPSFKYLITSEFGTSPEGRHHPHYHMLFFFDKHINFNTFRNAFINSQFVNGKRVFGRIFQCDLIDPAKGGIRYSAKYVCKDMMFEHQRVLINELIKFKKEYVNSLFNIVSLPQNLDEEFYNKCVRQNKEYRKVVTKYVLPLHHMLQFYMLSNDLGVSAIVERYGKNLSACPLLNFEGFPYSLPRLVKQRIEQNFGVQESLKLDKQIFMNNLKTAVDTLVFENSLQRSVADDLTSFAERYIIPRSGCLYLFNPSGLDLEGHLLTSSQGLNFDQLISDYNFFFDNDFITMRSLLLSVLARFNNEDRMMFRASVAHQKTEKESAEYLRKKLNNAYKR